MEYSRETSDVGFGDGLKNYCRLGEASLWSAAVDTVGDLDAVGRAGIERLIGDF